MCEDMFDGSPQPEDLGDSQSLSVPDIPEDPPPNQVPFDHGHGPEFLHHRHLCVSAAASWHRGGVQLLHDGNRR